MKRPPPHKKRRSRFRRWVTVAAVLVVLFTVIGFFVVPPIVRSQMEKRLSAQLGRRVTVEKVRMNPYAASVTIENFAIHEPDNTTKFVGWRRLHVNADPWSSWKEWVVKEIDLDGFASRVGVNPDKTYNFSDILAKVAPPDAKPEPAPSPSEKPAKRPRGIRVGSLRVADASVDFSDRSRTKPFATTIGPLTFALTDFRTVPDADAPYRFEAVTESGEKLAWAGTLQAEPPASQGELSIENIILAKYSPYYAELIQADVVDGKLSLRGRYEASLAGEKPAAVLRDGGVQLRGLKVLERGKQESAVELPALDVSGIQANAATLKATIDKVAITGGHVRARREKDGTINLLTMLSPPGSSTNTPSGPPATPPGSAPAEGPKPDATVGEFALKEFRVEVDDLAAPRPAKLALSDIQVTLRNLSLAEGAQMPLQAGFNWAPNGTVRIDGTVAIAPVKAEVTVDVAGLDVLPVSPYLEQFANARLTQGALTAGLSIDATMTEGQPPAATVVGGLKIEKLGLVDSAHNEELAGFGDMTLRGLRVTTAPEMTVALEEVNIAAPFARVIMNKDKTLNLATIAASQPARPGPPAADGPHVTTENTTISAPSTAQPAATEAAAALPKIDVAKIVISDGDFRFSDRSLEPNVNIAVNQFSGTISGLSSTNPAKADLDVKAMVDGAGPIAMAGKIDPLAAKPSFDVKVDFKNVDLVPLSPYSGKFAGFELARGKLVLDVKATVDGDKVDAANVITLNQFTFGSPVKSPDATSLPVKLGVALLKDTEGKIVIDVPVKGSTTDPSFGVGRVIGRVIVNLLTKAAVSPFALLGSLFGGGGDELAFQEFAPGSTEFKSDEVKKLETMVKALTNRPGLSLDLQGSYDPAADAPALKQVKFADGIRRAIWEQKRAANPNTPPPAQLEITPEEEAAMIKKIYDDRFPPGTRYGAPIPPPPEMLPAPPPPTGAMARFFDSITNKTEREAKAVQEENNRRLAEHAKAIEAAVTAGLPLEDMRKRLIEDTEVDENDLRSLAQARAQKVRDYFVNMGKISPDRLFLAKDKPDAPKEVKGARVSLGLQ